MGKVIAAITTSVDGYGLAELVVVLLVRGALARQARELTASPNGLKQLGGHPFCTRRACGVAWGTTTPQPYRAVTPTRPRAITLPGSLLCLTPNPNRRCRLVRQYPANRGEPASLKPANQLVDNGTINNARNQNASRKTDAVTKAARSLLVRELRQYQSRERAGR
jgi:hypothetical protein